MNLFENFDVTGLTFRKPPADNSLTTFKELQELNNLKLDKDFVVQKDNIIDNFEKINSAAGLDFPKNEITKLQNDSTSVIKNLIAKVLTDKYPQLREQYNKEAEDISNSRNIGRAHYRSDSKFGQEVGERMYEYLKNNKYAL